MKLKRLIAGIVSAIITVSSLSSSFASAAIDTKDADLKNKVNVENLNDYSIEPLNSLGRILEKEMLSDENQEQSSEETEEYGVKDINVEYGKALVAFNTNDNASVIVGLYDEQTGDMIASAAADITPDENYVEVEFDVMPDDYFIAKGYLVDSDTLAPLSEVFENNCYTREEQEFYSITPEDFDSEKVLLFNKEDKQNFAAFDEKAKIIQYSEGINVLTTNDLENGYYVIENASDEVMDLSPDDIFVMYYGDEMPLMIKVGEVTVNGTTVAIKDTETGIDEVFEFFRMDSGVCEPEFNEEDLLEGTEIIYNTQETHLPDINTLSAKKAAKKDDKVENENKFDFGIDNTGVAWATYTKEIKVNLWKDEKPIYMLKGGYDIFKNTAATALDVNVKATGDITLKVGGELRFSFSKNGTGKKYLKMALNSDITFNGEFTGAISAIIPLSPKPINIPLGESGFIFRIRPEIDIELTGKLSLNAKLTKSIGFEYDGTKSESESKKPINETAVASLDLDADVSLYIGLNLHPSLTWVSEKIFVVDIKKFGAGLMIDAKQPIISGEISTENDWVEDDDEAASIITQKTERHTCRTCFDITADIVFKIESEIRIFTKKPDLGGINTNKGNSISFNLPKIHLGYFYLSLRDENWHPKLEFGKGKCPHKKFLCTLNVTDKDTGEELSNTDITISDSKGNSIAKGNTGKNGMVRIWLAPEKYIISASSDGYSNYSSKKNLVYKGVREKGKDFGNESYSLYIDGKKTQDIQIKMDNTKYKVTVNVVDESNNPVDAIIACSYTTKLSSELLKAAEQLLGITLNGSKTFKLPNGEHYFTITAPGYETSQQSVEVNDSDSDITVILKPGSPTDISGEETSTTTTVSTSMEVQTTTTTLPITDGLDDNPYWVIFHEGFRNNRIELSTFNADDDCYIVWDTNLKCPSQIGNSNQYFFDNDKWTKIGSYDILTDKTTEIIASNVDIYDKNGNLVMAKTESSLDIGDTGKYDLLSYEVLDDGTIEITECRYNAVDVIIPKTIKGRKVTSIGNRAFSYCTSLKGVTIPDSVTSIGNNAFNNCSVLREIKIPNSVVSIDDRAFYNCRCLIDITIPDSVTSIGSEAFAHCRRLTDITISDSVTSIGNKAFYYCESLPGITIPNSVTSIGSETFAYCVKLTDISIPDSVTSIGYNAFYDCEGLPGITIPNSVISIGSWAFSGCTSLTDIIIPDSVTEIDGFAFEGCTNLIGITISNSVTEIDNYVFRDCTSLTEITIPDSVTSIRGGAFSHCTNLTTITIPDSVTSFGDYAFYECTNLTDVYYSGTEEQWNNIYDFCSCLENVTIHYNSTGAKKTASLMLYPLRSAAKPTEILTGLWENTLYNVYAMNSRDAENRLSSDNLLYITQTTSDSNGKIDAGYIREKFPNAEIFAVCINGDKPEEQQSDIKVITVSGTGNSLNVPENTRYVSSDPSVAEIDKDGNITIVSEGYAAVIAVTDNGCEVVSLLDVNNGDKPNLKLGNVNGDNLVDTRDAAAILRHSTLVSSNMPGILTGDQLIAADVDGNGIVDTKDAQMLLAYSTWASSVPKDQVIMLEEWIANRKK